MHWYSLDAGLLRGMLEYVAARTDLLRKSGERFVATPGYSSQIALFARSIRRRIRRQCSAAG